MVISYLARIPEKASFCASAGATIPRREGAVEANTNSEVLFGETSLYLMGRFTDEARDVCAAYYQSKAKRRPPYLALANSTGDLASSLDFTAKWGPLGHSLPILPGWAEAIGKPPCPWKGDHKDFLIDLAGWAHLHRRFRQLCSFAAGGSRLSAANRKNITDFLCEESWNEFDAGPLRLGLEWNTTRSGWTPQIVTASLYQAFVAMLWLDISRREQMLLYCANSSCGKLFVTSRTNKLYCDAACAAKVARLKWWRTKGKKNRQKKRIPGPAAVKTLEVSDGLKVDNRTRFHPQPTERRDSQAKQKNRPRP
jgi:hypothetical protein